MQTCASSYLLSQWYVSTKGYKTVKCHHSASQISGSFVVSSHRPAVLQVCTSVIATAPPTARMCSNIVDQWRGVIPATATQKPTPSTTMCVQTTWRVGGCVREKINVKNIRWIFSGGCEVPIHDVVLLPHLFACCSSEPNVRSSIVEIEPAELGSRSGAKMGGLSHQLSILRKRNPHLRCVEIEGHNEKGRQHVV